MLHLKINLCDSSQIHSVDEWTINWIQIQPIHAIGKNLSYGKKQFLPLWSNFRKRE